MIVDLLPNYTQETFCNRAIFSDRFQAWLRFFLLSKGQKPQISISLLCKKRNHNQVGMGTSFVTIYCCL